MAMVNPGCEEIVIRDGRGIGVTVIIDGSLFCQPFMQFRLQFGKAVL